MDSGGLPVRPPSRLMSRMVSFRCAVAFWLEAGTGRAATRATAIAVEMEYKGKPRRIVQPEVYYNGLPWIVSRMSLDGMKSIILLEHGDRLAGFLALLHKKDKRDHAGA